MRLCGRDLAPIRYAAVGEAVALPGTWGRSLFGCVCLPLSIYGGQQCLYRLILPLVSFPVTLIAFLLPPIMIC
jgi:hypothetical protein